MFPHLRPCLVQWLSKSPDIGLWHQLIWFRSTVCENASVIQHRFELEDRWGVIDLAISEWISSKVAVVSEHSTPSIVGSTDEQLNGERWLGCVEPLDELH